MARLIVVLLPLTVVSWAVCIAVFSPPAEVFIEPSHAPFLGPPKVRMGDKWCAL